MSFDFSGGGWDWGVGIVDTVAQVDVDSGRILDVVDHGILNPNATFYDRWFGSGEGSTGGRLNEDVEVVERGVGDMGCNL